MEDKTTVMDTGPGDNDPRDTRTRWIIGVLLALVIGLGVGLVIAAGDNSDDDETTVTRESTEAPTESATEEETTEEETVTEETGTGTTGGTKAPEGSGGFAPGQP